MKPNQYPQSAEQTTLPQEEVNRELLRNSELGVILERAYIDAMNVDPRLSEIAVVPITDNEEQHHAFATPAWSEKNQTGKHEIHLRLDDLDGTLAFFGEAMKIEKNTEKIAQTMGIRPGEVTPQLLYVQSMLHEMGHTLEFFDYQEQGKTPDEHRHDHKAERNRLPIGGVLVSRLLKESSPTRQAVVDQWDAASKSASSRYSNHVGEEVHISTMDELIYATADVYRDTKFEHAADNFAADVLQRQPVMMQQLTGNIDAYRNYPIAP